MSATELPRDNLVRAVSDGVEFRADPEDGRLGTLTGSFIPLGSWTEINSAFEGHFMERFSPSALKKTVMENRDRMRVLFNHGKDPQIGEKALGPITTLREDASYEVPLLDTSYNRDLLPGLKAGVYGASVRFQVVKEELKRDAGVSEHNPKGLPERTVTEAKVFEFGPVTFPAYEGATAKVRSLTEEFLEERAPLTTHDTPEGLGDPAVLEATPDEGSEPVEATPEQVVSDDEPEPASETTPLPEPDKAMSERQEEHKMDELRSVEEIDARLAEIEGEQNEIYSEWGVRSFDAETQDRWDGLKEEKELRISARKEFLERKAYIESQSVKPEAVIRGAGSSSVVATRNAAPDNIFDMSEYHTRSSSQEHMSKLLEEGANRAIEGFHYPNPKVDEAQASEAAQAILDRDSPDKEIAQRLLVHGSPTYRKAFWKTLAKQPLTAEEQRKLSEGMQIERNLTAAGDGGITVPVQIDPTVLLTSNGALNPFRRVARIVRTTSYQWQGVTSTGITSAYALEGAAMSDNAPTLIAPAINPERASSFVPFTWEAAQDWGSLEGEMATMFADSKDVLEATKFAVGAGHASNEPQGVLVGAGTVVGTAGTVTVGTVDIYALEAALPVRFQANASWLATPALWSRIRQQSGGQQYGIWADSLQVGMPDRLLGYPAYKASSVGTAGNVTTPVASTKWGIFGDFNFFAIVDRIGFQVRLIDNLVSGTAIGYPVGMSGLVSYWRNSSGVLSSSAFRTGTVT